MVNKQSCSTVLWKDRIQRSPCHKRCPRCWYRYCILQDGYPINWSFRNGNAYHFSIIDQLKLLKLHLTHFNVTKNEYNGGGGSFSPSSLPDISQPHSVPQFKHATWLYLSFTKRILHFLPKTCVSFGISHPRADSFADGFVHHHTISPHIGWDLLIWQIMFMF